jgi:3'-phosphoadenosine 5'-phosphosulfate sulfotransferase (PAPS reductase)/FAD synthetase
MEPTREFVQAFLANGADVLMLSGVRAAESSDRAKLPEREFSAYFGCEVLRPLLSWTLEEVWAIHRRYGIEPNPLYAMGAKRVGCLPCIMSRKREIANIAARFPERIEFLREAERSVPSSCGFSSFFAKGKAPLRYRKTSITTKEGKTMAVASIDDIVAWAKNDPDLYTETLDFDVEEAPACDSRYGACE